ncbi:NUDIX hydrolase [Streptomyces corynorhini]|uniref:NUDIX domain-containing protein n=1 Tax=Streptomyces corynorhini TaxID=2282652 RepID=A0A370B9Z3_9ACTN|nr:NUDIX domain-containing protein [Streptomyces corynorhini]RDG36255.1 NUDIX domain-containing protein [Streptomyces corynorhini]
MTTPPLRKAARVIALDDDHRVLLLHYDEGGSFWATPGGSLETGEDYDAAALRELHEELGVDEKDVALSGQLAERSQDHAVGGREVRQIERYFLAHLSPGDLDPARATQPDNIRAHRWWTLQELRSTRETVYPLGLSDLITDVLTAGVPEYPVVLH